VCGFFVLFEVEEVRGIGQSLSAEYPLSLWFDAEAAQSVDATNITAHLPLAAAPGSLLHHGAER
jgi:hypothetical protein